MAKLNEHDILYNGYKGHTIQFDNNTYILDNELNFWCLSDLINYIDEHNL